ncbi:RDD family protein [Arthrobacter alpinus]|nr:RDD family protein [Arthrobacter alpinus]
MSAIITGEAVVLELRPASFAARSVATAIDLFVTLAVGFGLFLLLFQLAFTLDPAAIRVMVLTTIVGLLVIVPVTVETLSRGKSLGKLAMGLRIVRTTAVPSVSGMP